LIAVVLEVGGAVFVSVAIVGFAAHFDLAARLAALVASVVGLIRTVLLALFVIAILVRGLVRWLLGLGEVEILEQTSGQRREGGLVVDRQSQRVELGRSLVLDPRRNELEPCPRRLGGQCAGQALAGEEADRSGERDFLGGSCAGNRIAPHPRLGEVGEIAAYPRHGARAERFDPRALECIEHRARFVLVGRASEMKRGIGMSQPKRHRIGRPARLRDQAWFKRWPRRLHPRHLADRARRTVLSECDLRLSVLRDGTSGPGQHAAKSVKGVGGGHALPTTLSGRSLPNTRW
jgi:hypothetical protein